MDYKEAEKFYNSIDLLKEEVDISETLQNIKSPPQIFLYGAGNLGQQIFQALEANGVKVTAFLDRSAAVGQTLLGVPVHSPNDPCITAQQRQAAIVLITIFLPQSKIKEIEKAIKAYGFANVMIKYNLIYPWLPFMSQRDSSQLALQKEKIITALALMQDEESCKIFCSNLKAHACYEYENALVSEDMEQYFDVKVPFSKGFSHFVDCGAFTGDSLEKLLKYHSLSSYYAFEPDVDNYKKLETTVNGYSDKMQTALLFPCGVSDKNDFLSFQSGENSASTVTESGDTTIQVVALDSVLKKAPVTLIKMDIEGSEKAAIMGARQIIQAQKPDLAICVYHKISDMWEFPLLLQKLVPEYKFYMRCHNSLTMETVLYATI